MEYIHTQKNISASPRKLRLVADMVRKMDPLKAIEILSFTQKDAAMPLSKAIKTALANVGKEGLNFKKIEINEGPKMRRYRVGTAGRGRGRPYKRRLSHIKIVLSDELSDKLQETSNKRSNKKENERSEKKVVMDDSVEQPKLSDKVTVESSK